jgi:phosphonate transport system substrate-binding protein
MAISRTLLSLLALLALAPWAAAQDAPYTFNVLNQRTVALTSQYWNPILLYVSRKSGVPLELRLARTSMEADTLAEQGAYHFIYSNHFFTPEREKFGFRPIARPVGAGIRGAIVVRNDSPLRTLQDLAGREVAFANPEAFAGYWLPMDGLLKAKVAVKAVFMSNQEAGLAQLKVGSLPAAAANAVIAERYARRVGLDYRVLWSSDLYNDLAIMASPKVSNAKAHAVRDAFVGMLNDPEGRKILETGADLLKIQELGFVAASDRDYDNYRTFYRKTLVKQQTDAAAPGKGQ